MIHARSAQHVRQIRHAILTALRIVYPAAMPADQILRSLLALFPALSAAQMSRDLLYLAQKGYLERAAVDPDPDPLSTGWRPAWNRLTAAGVEAADRDLGDTEMDV